MSVRHWARTFFVVAGLWLVGAVVAFCFGAGSAAMSAALSGAFWIIVACALQVASKFLGRKTNGRYRKALEAHRAGAGGSAGDSTRGGSGRGAVGTGAGMSGAYSSGGFIGGRGAGKSFLEQLLNDALRAQPKHVYPQALPPGASYHAGGPSLDTDPAPAVRPAGDFDGVSFAAGVVTGTRAFDVDKLGRLIGVAYAVVWTPGENQAKCMHRDEFGSLMYGSSRVELREARRAPHSIADCAHGFYGYYEGSNDYYAEGRVMAVVEGYGDTVIGTRGFRASKARIVALHIPGGMNVGRRRLIARNYAGIPIFDSFDAMVAEFPPDDGGHGLNPDTDPDFWTREA